MNQCGEVDALTAKVAQLWCQPQHAKKEMDAEFAQSIIELVEDETQSLQTLLKSAEDVVEAAKEAQEKIEARAREHHCAGGIALSARRVILLVDLEKPSPATLRGGRGDESN